jgi:hypothetical protein
MTITAQTPIRLQMSVVSNPPVSPVDANTGNLPKWWRAANVSLQCAIFAPDGTAVDLTAATAVQLVIQPTPSSSYAVLNKTVLAAAIVKTITVAGWQAGTAQQFTFPLTNAETDFDLGGADSAQFWLSIRVWTSSTAYATYGAGYVEVFNPGLILPIVTPGLVSYHTTANATGNSTITPTSLVHTEQLTFTGTASVRNIILDPTGLTKGTRLDMAVVMAALANGAIINFYTTSTAGTLLLTFTKLFSESNALFRFAYDGVGDFIVVEQVIYPQATPATNAIDTTITDETHLAAVATALLTPPVIRIWIQTVDNTTQTWILRAGTDAAEAGSIVRPTDYNAGTNAKVWYRSS